MKRIVLGLALAWAFFPPRMLAAANDLFADRLEIVAPFYQIDGSFAGTTHETGEPLPPETTQTLWWKFVAPERGLLGISLTAPQFNPTLTLYEGNTLASVQSLTPIKDSRFLVQAGHEYALQLAAQSGVSEAFSLEVRFQSLTNDSFLTSTRLEGTNAVFVGTVLGSTLAVGEPFPGYSNSIWAIWTAPFSGRASFFNSVPSWAQPVKVYAGSGADELQTVITLGMGGSRNDFLTIGGEVYHFQIAGVDGLGDECQMSLELVSPGTPTNDMFAAARTVAGMNFDWYSSADLVWMGNATAEPGEPPHLNGAPFKSIWWHWTAPAHGSVRMSVFVSFTTNAMLAIYRGTSVEALTLVAKSTSEILIPITGGEKYYIAVAVPPETQGDAVIAGTVRQVFETRPVPGNILREPSWEGINLESSQYWEASSGIGGGRNERGGCDGLYWLTLNGHPLYLWQEIPTEPGKPYGIRFAMRSKDEFTGGGGGDGLIGVLWDGREVGVAVLPDAERGFWHWPEFTTVASNTTSRITFVNLARNMELDAFSVVALADPPAIVAQPSSASAIADGSVVFAVNASGSGPLTYYWYFNQTPLSPQSNPGLFLDSVTAEQAGTYHVVVSNAFGMVTSDPVTLTVESPTKPVIVWQPYGDTVGLGSIHRLSVVAVGAAPLTYQWTRNGENLSGATNRILTFEAITNENEGIYAVRVENHAGITWSLDAVLNVDTNLNGGGLLNFRNQFFNAPQYNAPVFDVDGITRLAGSNYLAQLYGGPSLELLRPLGRPRPFFESSLAGSIRGEVVMLPSVPPSSNAVVQVRTWDATTGDSYEEARGLGGRFGKSEFLVITLGSSMAPPVETRGLQSFNLQAGRSEFVSGEIVLTEQHANGTIVWSHTGEPGYRYLIERSLEGFEWHPFRVITNVASTVTFTDVAGSGGTTAFYRSRILD